MALCTSHVCRTALFVFGSMAGSCGIYYLISYFKSRATLFKRKSPYVENYKKGLVYLFQFPRLSVVPNISPYCLKLETWLRIKNIEYKNVLKDCSKLIFSKQGLLPFIELDGVEYPNSELAIIELTSRFPKSDDATKHLSLEQEAALHAVECLVEKSILPASLFFRQNTGHQLMELFEPGTLSPAMIKKKGDYWNDKIYNMLLYQEFGKYSYEDVCKLTEADLIALSKFLGNKHYFAGFKASKSDATIFGVLALVIFLPFDNPQRKFIDDNCSNINEFVERIKERYWPDWEEATIKFSIDSNWKRKL